MNESSPYQSPASEDSGEMKAGPKWPTPLEWVVIVAIVAILVALLLPPVEQARVTSSRTACRNQLRQIGLALHNYHDTYGTFPPAFVADENGIPQHSWRVLILPFLESSDTYSRYRFNEPWNGPNNIQLQDRMPYDYACSNYARDAEPGSVEQRHLSRLSNFVAVTGPGTVFPGNHPSQSADLKSLDSIVAVAEVRQHAVHWMSPHDVTPDQLLTDLRRSAQKKNANHEGGLHVLFASGRAWWLEHDLAEQEFRNLFVDAE